MAGEYFTPAVRKIAEEWPGRAPRHRRRDAVLATAGDHLAAHPRRRGPAGDSKHCGTSVEMLERSYSFAIEDLEDDGPKPAEEERLRARQIALTADKRRRLRVA